jgi:hypothetical protein
MVYNVMIVWMILNMIYHKTVLVKLVILKIEKIKNKDSFVSIQRKIMFNKLINVSWEMSGTPRFLLKKVENVSAKLLESAGNNQDMLNLSGMKHLK